MSLRKTFLVAMTASLALSAPAYAEDVNCANEFRSGKLYFSQNLYRKSVGRFDLAVETCPDKAEYRWRYGLALCAFGDELMDEALIAGTAEEQAAKIDTAMTTYGEAGHQFDESVVVDDSKKNRKYVRENRDHYWVEHYNRGLQLFKDDNFRGAEIEFRICRLINPANEKAYAQGANALASLGKNPEAADLVKQGLKLAPEDENLNKLLEILYLEAGAELRDRGRKMAGDAETAPEAETRAGEAAVFLTQVLERRGGEDPDVLIQRGDAYSILGDALRTQEKDSSEVCSAYLQAAEDFDAAAALVPIEEDLEAPNTRFHKAAVFSKAQALNAAAEFDNALGAVNELIQVDPTDDISWRLMAQTLMISGDQEKATEALMVSKALSEDGKMVEVSTAVSDATEDAAVAVTDMGEPEEVRWYQSGESQIFMWLWRDKKTARTYILGEQVGEMTW